MTNDPSAITEDELVALEHYRGDGRKMYADVAAYRLTTLEENPDAENQRRPGTLRGQAAAFITAAGGVVAGRVLHHHMLTHAQRGKWDYGYVHMVSNKNLVKRGASRDWIRSCGASGLPTEVGGALPLSPASPTSLRTQAASAVRVGDDRLVLQQLTITTEQVEARQNPKLLAHRDAQRQGARFVALRNAEFTWLWDRCAGRTYDRQFVGRFAPDVFDEAFAHAAAARRQQDAQRPELEGDAEGWSLVEYQERLSDIVRGIRLLRADPDHVERAHERLVDHFLVRLGFDPYSEIGFRNGRIDMTIHVEGKPSLALEVKRDWRLREESVLDQAYNYSLEHGIRFFAATNGDDYILHDCWRSLSRQENEVARFRLSALGPSDLPCLNWLRSRRFATGA